ncbi:MAG: TonB-dependent receptor [Candidatus Aminicenantes bacterium]|nr:TonB-dependent receptor [Candidatus Aminicenantes bacterium]
MKFKKLFTNVIPVFLFLGLISFTLAQTTGTTGTIRGTVKDDQGIALPGVEITVSGPTLQGIRSTTARENGSFQLVGIPPGTYQVEAKLQGFTTITQTNVKVYLDSTTSIDFTMPPSTIEQTVTVVASAPVIDTTKTEVGADFDSDILENMPTGRSFQDVIYMSPGAVNAGVDGNASIMGASAAENRYIIDGVDTTDPIYGIAGTNIPYNFIEEIEVKSGGYQAEYGGALGGVVNVLVKSGGNEFHGSVFGYFNNDSLSGETPAVSRTGKTRGYDKYDIGLDIGGYFIKDKIWFYSAFNPFWTSDYLTTSAGSPGSGIAGIDVTEKTSRPYFAGKFSVQINPDHKLVLSAFGDFSSFKNQNEYLNVKAPIRHDADIKGYDVSLSYDWVINKDMYFTLVGALHRQKNTVTPANDIPLYEDGTSNNIFSQGYSGLVYWGGSINRNGDKRHRSSLKSTLSWFLSNHQIKLGAEYRHNYAYQYIWNCGPGSDPQLEAAGFTAEQPGAFWRLRDGYYYNLQLKQDTEGVSDEFAIYIQDTWDITSWFSLMLGVRAEYYELQALERPPNPQIPTSGIQNKVKFDLFDQLAPRVGFSMDPLQNGKSKIFGHYGKYYESIPLNIGIALFGYNSYQIFFYTYPTDSNGNPTLPNWDNPGDLFATFFTGGQIIVQPNSYKGWDRLHSQYTQEFILGAEYEIVPDMSVGIKGIYRSLEAVIEDFSFDGGVTYILSNPEGYAGVNELTGEPLNFPKPERKYTALEISLKKKLSNNYQFYLSYILSRNEGNHGGLFRQDNGQLSPNATSAWDLPSLLFDPVTGEQVAYGLLNNDRTHQLKFYGSYHVPSGFFKGLSIGLYSAFLSGTPISKLGEHPTYGPSERFVFKRGSAGRTGALWWVDLHLEYPFVISKFKISAILDSFNVFNSFNKNWAMSTTLVDEDWSWGVYFDDPDPQRQTNPNWGNPLAYQDPWSFRFGLKLSW